MIFMMHFWSKKVDILNTITQNICERVNIWVLGKHLLHALTARYKSKDVERILITNQILLFNSAKVLTY